MSQLLDATNGDVRAKPAVRAGARSRFGRLLCRLGATLRPDRGQALVEMAIVLPILLMIVLGIIDFGRAVNYWNNETHVANLAARYAAVGTLPSDSTCGTGKYGSGETLTQYISCELGLDSSELASGSGTSTGPQGADNICISIPSDTQNQPVTVKLKTTYQWLPLTGSSWTASPVAGQATQMIENPPPSSWATTTAACP